MGLMVLFTEHPPVIAGWPADTAVFAANMFLAGVYEEACLRACACDALLPALKKTRHPFIRTALISGVLFGYVHVVSADFSDLQETLQFFLKMTNLAFVRCGIHDSVLENQKPARTGHCLRTQ